MYIELQLFHLPDPHANLTQNVDTEFQLHFVPSSEIFFSLNATIVGLAVDSEGPENLPSCLGLGIVRGIDIVKAMLNVITPVPHNSLEKVNVLLQGYIQIPSCLLQARYCFTFFCFLNVIL
ncbi:Polynucleotide 5'-hydroxyl-kinase NOL9 [Glycine soja]